MANTYLTRTPSSNGNRRIWTFSAWVKVCADTQGVLMGAAADTSNFTRIQFWGSGDGDRITVSNRFSGTSKDVTPSRAFKDFSGWYHIVTAVDTTQATASNRVKIWINGVQETNFQTSDYPDQNSDPYFNNTGYAMVLGNNPAYSHYYNGLMSHVNFVDGTAYQASDFGETDATTGEWKIKTSPSVTYGTNGFFLLKDGNSVTDQSGEGNNFTVGGGTLTNTEDNPSNVFCTLNPLIGVGTPSVYSYGNTKVASNASAWQPSSGTLAFTKGKFYWEIKGIAEALSMYGVAEASVDMNSANPQDLTGTTIFFNDSGGEVRKDGSNTSADYGTFGSTDVMGIACNMDDKEISFYKNGSAIVTDYALSTSIVTCIPFNSIYTSGGIGNFNFGNGYFADVAISSEGTNASNIGKFEFNVPTGYTALSTKGLNE